MSRNHIASSWHPDGPGVPEAEVRRVVEAALAEDLGWGDATTEALVPAGLRSVAVLAGRAEGVAAGLEVAASAFRSVDGEVEVERLARDGDAIRPGMPLLRVSGPARSLLTAERVALNFAQRLGGVATLTRRYVDAVAGTRARIVDTRKTTPGLRALEKYAVRCGGGGNHRFNLSDAVLVKDNHRAALDAAKVDMAEALREARRRLPHTIGIEVEVDRVEQIDAALDAGVDAILLDNMTTGQLREAVERIGGRAVVEASGGVTLETVAEVAATGVDLISVGALTHSAPALDLALDWEMEGIGDGDRGT